MYTSNCIYIDGQHVYPGTDCPHNQEEDEQGPIPETGWTIQQNR